MERRKKDVGCQSLDIKGGFVSSYSLYLGVATVIASRVVSFTVRACRDCLGCWARHSFVFPRTTSTDRSFRLVKLLRMTVTLTVQTATHFFSGVFLGSLHV